MTNHDRFHQLARDPARAAAIVDTLARPLLILDDQLIVRDANLSYYRQFKTDAESTLGMGVFALGGGLWNGGDLRQALRDVLFRSEWVVTFEVAATIPNLGKRTFQLNAQRLEHPGQAGTEVLLEIDDVSEQRAEELARNMLVLETLHRMKNLFAMVRSLAFQTEAESQTAAQYRDVLVGRVEALFRAHDYIAANKGTLNFSTFLQEAMEAVANGRAEIEGGPAVLLRENQVLPLSMIVHELATNAVKYGALSRPEGRIGIVWSVEQDEQRTRLVLDWRERGGPPVATPRHRGFGLELIDYSCAAEGGEARFSFEQEGLHVRLDFSLSG